MKAMIAAALFLGLAALAFGLSEMTRPRPAPVVKPLSMVAVKGCDDKIWVVVVTFSDGSVKDMSVEEALSLPKTQSVIATPNCSDKPSAT